MVGLYREGQLGEVQSSPEPENFRVEAALQQSGEPCNRERMKDAGNTRKSNPP